MDSMRLLIIAAGIESADSLKNSLEQSCGNQIIARAGEAAHLMDDLAGGSYDGLVLDAMSLGSQLGMIMCELQMRAPSLPVIVIVPPATTGMQSHGMFQGIRGFYPREAMTCELLRKTLMNDRDLAVGYWENRYRALNSLLRDGIVIWEPGGEIREVNAVFCDLCGRSQEDVVGRPFASLFVPEDVEETPLKIYEVLKGERVLTERRLVRTDGSRLWVEATSNLLVDGRIQTLMRDTTESRMAEESLRQQSMAITASLDGMAILSAEGKFLFLNSAHVRLYRYTCAEDLLGESWEVLFDEEERHRVRSEVMPAVLRCGQWRGENFGLRADGTKFAQEVTISRAEGGVLIIIVRDITDRRKAEQVQRVLFRISEATAETEHLEELLETMRSELSTLVDTTNFYIALYDPATETYSFPYFADQYDEFTPESQKLPQTLTDYVRRTGQSMFVDEAMFRRLSDQGEVSLCGTDSRLWLGVPLKTVDGVIGVMVVQSYDSTTLYSPGDVDLMSAISGSAAMAIQRKRTLDALIESEAQLRQSQKMEAIGRLAGGVAHDFNNLLTSILGHSELTLFKLHEGDPLRDGVEQVIKSAERAASLTRQLLAFSRKQVLQPHVLSLNSIVVDMEKMLRRLIGEDIELVTQLNPDLGAVRADPGQMEQVIMNLAVNARDAMPKGGRLVISTENVDLDDVYIWQHRHVNPGKYVVLAVTDNGSGMSAEVQSHIFEPFFTTKEYGKGTGLGLSTVYGIINQSGGYVWVYSELDKGTTFKIYLPLVEVDVDTVAAPAPLALPKNGTETILLVEDESGVRQLVKRVLQERGYTVLEAQLGEEALRIAHQYPERIHLLLSDIIMPGLGGQELAEQVSRFWPDVRILLMSGYTDDSFGNGKPGNGHHAFLPKPFSADSLVRIVRNVLDAPMKT
jgi:PAS domain S-box-containing protein